jgi:site-specific recombinase XerD
MANSSQPPIPKFVNFKQASEIWLARKLERFPRPNTLESYRLYLKSLLPFFGDMRLRQIDAASVLAYQTKRSHEVGPSLVNHEINVLSQVLRLAVCWGPISDSYKPLKEREWQKPKTLSAQEQKIIFSKAIADPELEVAAIAFAIMRNTGVTSNELRHARLRDLDLQSDPPTFRAADAPECETIPRLVPLNAEAAQAFRRAVERAHRLGTRYREQFIFPHRVNPRLWNPTRPASKSWLRAQTRELREATGIRHLNSNVWRDQLCKEMLEKGVPTDSIVAVLGRVSEKMIHAYKATSLAAKQEALGIVRPNTLAFPSKRSAQEHNHPLGGNHGYQPN